MQRRESFLDIFSFSEIISNLPGRPNNARLCISQHISAVLVTRSSHWWCGCRLDVSSTVVWSSVATGLESGHHPSPLVVAAMLASLQTLHRALHTGLHFYKIQSRLIKISWKAGVAVGSRSLEVSMVWSRLSASRNLKKNVPTGCNGGRCRV